eukprot:COSAG06_NODE_3599_length_5136_cov_24.510621_2_plen_277_part_00
MLLLSRRRHGVTAWQRSNSTHTAARKQWRRSLRKMPDVSSAPIPRVPCSRKWRHRSPRRAPPRGAADSAPVALTRGRVGGLTLAPAPPALRSRDGVAERALLKQKCAPVRPPPSPVLRGDWRGPISFLAVLAACTHSAVRLLPCNDITAKEEVANQVRAPLPPPWSYTPARLGPSCEPARTHESGLSPSRTTICVSFVAAHHHLAHDPAAQDRRECGADGEELAGVPGQTQGLRGLQGPGPPRGAKEGQPDGGTSVRPSVRPSVLILGGILGSCAV